MEIFGRFHHFEFLAHAIGHADRKAVVERNFHYCEMNFLAGRSFSDWNDLNDQALAWCQEVANAKPKRSLGMSPQAAWLMERAHLRPLPDLELPIYKAYFRVVDSSGFVNLDTNRYSVPDQLLGKRVEVHKHMNEVSVYHEARLVAEHVRLIDRRNTHVTGAGHHQPLKRTRQGACEEEGKLKNTHPDLDAYAAELKKRVRGRGVAQFRRLLNFKRSYPEDAFLAAVRHAHHYRLYDLSRLENLILERVAGDFFQLTSKGESSCD
jgi:hypothetical protein